MVGEFVPGIAEAGTDVSGASVVVVGSAVVEPVVPGACVEVDGSPELVHAAATMASATTRTTNNMRVVRSRGTRGRLPAMAANWWEVTRSTVEHRGSMSISSGSRL
jgi:hypothetical protein